MLLDACIVIEAHKLGIWENLIKKAEITVSSIVAHDGSLFYSIQENKIPESINLKSLIDEGKIKELSATREKMANFLNQFDSVFVAGLDDGEVESLSLIMSGKAADSLFCSGDALALKALAMIGHSDTGISMESLLKKTGLQKRLSKQFTDNFYKAQIKKGKQNLITGQGLKH